MATDKIDAWKNYLAISMVIYAVLSTIAWYKDSGHSTTAILSQAEASNHWSHYQAKSLKSYLYETERSQILLALETKQIQEPTAAARYQATADEYQKKIIQYESERTELVDKARAQEKVRDQAQVYSNAFGLAMMLLQVGLVLGGLASLLDKKVFWYLSLLVSLWGAIYFANGWFLFF